MRNPESPVRPCSVAFSLARPRPCYVGRRVQRHSLKAAWAFARIARLNTLAVFLLYSSLPSSPRAQWGRVPY